MAQETALVVEAVALPAGFDLLELHAAQPDRYPYLLESVATDADGHGPADGFDILFAFPGPTLSLDSQFRLHGVQSGTQETFLPALDDWWQSQRHPARDDAGLPFRGGWFIYLAYELVREIEPSIRPLPPVAGPVAFATRIPVALLRNRRSGLAWIIAEATHRQAVADVQRDLADSSAGPRARSVSIQPLVTTVCEPQPAAFLAGVRAVRNLISGGDVYQVNLARQWHAEAAAAVTPADIYRQLRCTNPAPYAGLARLGDWSLISSSPERLVRCRQGSVETRPIAGTRPTADDPTLEDERRRELLANSKERAEHVMLIDLERNDLGRISEPGSVEVDEFMAVESYAHVHHIVSNVRGRLRADVSPGDVIRAMFPGGTITGCPKVRCMAIIAGLEAEPRGGYTGSMGYLNRDGSCDLNILIRTIFMRGRKLSFAAGSGIVADSDPQRELEETRAKVKGLLLALGG